MPQRPKGYANLRPAQGPNGQWYSYTGERVTREEARDLEYAERYFRTPRGRVPGKREAMSDEVKLQALSGEFGAFVSPTGIEEDDREKLSAYRVLAQGIGHDIGQFTFHPNAHTASAPIRRINRSE